MKKIAFIGAGNMARAIIIGLVNSGVPASDIMVANPSSEKRLQLANEFGVHQTDDNNKAGEFADIIVLSVKPHLICDVCQQLSHNINISGKLFVSVAAGTTLAQIQQALNEPAPTVRVMPNLARFRVNAFNQNRGPAAVFRTIPSKISSLGE